MHTRSKWQVLLIGGSSATGKTSVARQLSSQYGLPLLLVDDVRLALQATTTPSSHPEIHTFVSAGTKAFRSAEVVFQGLRIVAEAIEPALRIIISHHIAVADAGPIVLEGDGLLPRLASAEYLSSQAEFPGVIDHSLVAGVFLIENDRAQLGANMKSRGRGFNDMSDLEQSALVEGSFRFGQFLRDEAREYEVESVETAEAESRLRELFDDR